MKLVEDWRRWWKWGSTYAFAVLTAFPVIWLSSPELQALLPPKVVSVIAPFIGVIGFVLRLRCQASKNVKDEESQKEADDGAH